MSAMKEFLSNSYLFGANAPFIEELYEAYLGDPQSVPEQWREYFERLQRLPTGASARSRGRAVALPGRCGARCIVRGRVRPQADLGAAVDRGISLPGRVDRGHRSSQAPRAPA